jgi:hypothetical protein
MSSIPRERRYSHLSASVNWPTADSSIRCTLGSGLGGAPATPACRCDGEWFKTVLDKRRRLLFGIVKGREGRRDGCGAVAIDTKLRYHGTRRSSRERTA